MKAEPRFDAERDHTTVMGIVSRHKVPGTKYVQDGHCFAGDYRYLGEINGGKVEVEVVAPVFTETPTTTEGKIIGKEGVSSHQKKFNDWVDSLKGMGGKTQLMKYVRENLGLQFSDDISFDEMKKKAKLWFKIEDEAA